MLVHSSLYVLFVGPGWVASPIRMPAVGECVVMWLGRLMWLSRRGGWRKCLSFCWLPF